MDFFEAQDAARRRTSALIALFVVAVLAIIAVVYAAVHVAVGPGTRGIDLFLLIQVALGVGVVIAIGTGIRTASLRRGGPAVAELLGGRRVPSDTTDPEERVFLNIVEEMSIASGTPIPAVYVLDGEDGINAFAAGYSTHDAAVAITRGALRSLTRDELQGVVAHEFSHILNGDMRLNIRLIGVLYGILLLAVVGRGIVYGSRGGMGGGRRGNGGAGWIVLVGLALLLVGYVGVVFGKLIKAAVSRQREYLADSAAVQFTRNPSGLAGALKKIGEEASGSRIQDHHAEELSHLFFANGLRSTFFGFLSTHPPLEERIRRIDATPSMEDGAGTDRPRPASRAAAPGDAGGLSALAGLAAPAALLATVGAPTPNHLAYAAAMLKRFPPRLTAAVHDRTAAQAVVFALVAADRPRLGDREREVLGSYGGDSLVGEVEELVPVVREQGPDALLPLLDLSLPSLLSLSPAEATRFREVVGHLIRADGRILPFEFALAHTLSRRLATNEARASSATGVIRSFDSVVGDVEAVLSAVAWAGSGGDAEAAAAAFRAGAHRLPGSAASIHLRDPAEVGLDRVDEAFDRLERASAAVRRAFLEACAECAAYDGRLRPEEVELLRAIAEALDCPMPPMPGATPPAPQESGRG
jgi:Zn-dependent protease with chaperone function